MAAALSMTMKRGDLVQAETFSQGVVVRRVVEILQHIVYICREDEWESALKEGREPEGAGFNIKYVRPVTARTESQNFNG